MLKAKKVRASRKPLHYFWDHRFERMKIVLKNFRCHKNATFEIPDQGLIALSGPSSAGKSTILTAITYAFYGKIPGKNKKPHRSKSAKVQVEYQGMTITRISKPKSISVAVVENEGDEAVEYEGDAAESVIVNTLSMNYEEFLAGAYIVQRSNASVLSMTPTEQISFVEILAETQRVSEFKELVKEKIKEIKNLKLKNQGEIESLQVQLDEKYSEASEEIPETPKEILDGFDPEKAREKIKKLEASLKAIQNTLGKLSASLVEARESEKEKILVEKKISTVETEIKQLYGILAKIKGSPTKESINKMENTVKDTEAQIKIYESGVAAFKEKRKLEEAVQDFIVSSEATLSLKEPCPTLEEILELETASTEAETIKKDYEVKLTNFNFEKERKETARGDLRLIFKEIKQILPTAKDVKSPGKMLEILKKLVKNQRHKNHVNVSCPLCQGNLFYDPTTSELLENTVEDVEKDGDTIEDANITLEVLEGFAEKINVSSKILNTPYSAPDPGLRPEDPMISYKTLLKTKRSREDYLALQKQIESAKDGEGLPPLLTRMKARVEKALSDFYDSESAYPGERFRNDNPGTDWDMESLEACIVDTSKNLDDAKTKLSKAREIFSIRAEHSSVIKTKEGTLSNLCTKLKKLGESSKSRDLEAEISKKTQLLMTTQNSISSLRDVLDSIADYETYQAYLASVEELTNRISAANETSLELDSRMEGFLGLSEAGRESEIVSLEKTVNSINEHAKIYLEQMFEQVPLVRLECVKNVKSTKSDKLQMNTSIHHKGEKYESIEELSGGERQRCDIAFLLAVSDIVGSRILLLDECLNNLNEEINTETLTMIKEMCADKLIIVVSHEAVKGIFDFIVDV